MIRWPWLLALVTTAALADDPDVRIDNRPLDFSLQFSHDTGDLKINGATLDTSTGRIGIAWRERFSDRVQLGLTGGWASVTTRDDSLTAGRALNGYYAGFLLDVDLLKYDRFDSFANATWRYQQVDHDDGVQRVVIVTREPNFRIGAGLQLGGGVRAYAGVRYQSVGGEERLSGALNQTRAIDSDHEVGGFGGLELRVDPDGYVGINGEWGTDRSVGIYFGRHF